MIGQDYFADLLYSASLFLTSSFGIQVISSIVLILFLRWLYRFNRSTRTPRRELRELLLYLEEIKTAEEFRAKYEQATKKFRESELIGHQWQEYQETLIFDESENGGQVRTVHSPHEFFSVSALLGRKANLRFFDAVPSILTGLGILGTFLGLTAGIYVAKDRIATQDTTEMLNALTALLGGASMAFLTSIVGIFTALLFSWWEKRIVHRLESKMTRFCELLDKFTIRLTPEQLAFETLKETKEQRVQLQRFNTELAVSIASALDEKLAASLTPSLNKLVEIMEDIRTNRSDQSESMIREITEQFKASMTDAAGDELTRLSNVLEQVSSSLEQSLTTIKSSSESASDQLLTAGIELNDAIKAAGVQLQEQMGRSSESFAANMAEATKCLTEGMASFQTQIERLGRVVESGDALMNRSNDLQNSLDNTLRDIIAIHRSIGEIVEPLQNTAGAMESMNEQSSKSLQAFESLSSTLKELNESSTQVNSTMKQTWADINSRFGGLDETLQGSFANLQDGVDNYTEKIKKFVLDLDGHFSKAIKEFSGNIEELSEALEDAITKLTADAKE